MTNSWDAYYDAFKTIFKDEDGDEATFDEELVLSRLQLVIYGAFGILTKKKKKALL